MTSHPQVAVVGGGHAGIEAALASARLGVPTVLVTPRLPLIGRMPCNPAVGGMAKGHLVREVDALGGAMGELADAACIQFKRLGTSRGLAVQSSRAQCDKFRYRLHARRMLDQQPGLSLVEGEVVALVLEGERVRGLVLGDGSRLPVDQVVLCTGTFLGGLLHTGFHRSAGGRAGEAPSVPLAQQLRALGLDVGRLKTGTVPRLDRRTIAWDRLGLQEGDEEEGRFSFYRRRPRLPQVDCRVTHTTAQTQDIIQGALDRSPVHVGLIEGPGPRYCPSIEDKIHRFPDRDAHRIFLEPEGLESLEVYPNGISTALPVDVQWAFVRSIPGLEKARIVRPGYAVEYDFINPQSLDHRLALKALNGLFLAGQVNGTTGYEEAAAQGLWAGTNAALAHLGRDPFLLRRDQAYLGVLVDDLVTRGVSEPYRMFSSRAEHRLHLREDNANERLMPLGHELGLVSDELWALFSAQMERRAVGRQLLEERLTPTQELTDKLRTLEIEIPRSSFLLGDLLTRRGSSWEKVCSIRPALRQLMQDDSRALEAAFRYQPYLEENEKRILQERRWMDRTIPEGLDYAAVGGLRKELVELFSRVRPNTLGEASRLRGSTPAAMTALIVHLGLRGEEPRVR